MKLRSTLSGIAALLLVGTFYSFAFCMVEDVEDTPISMDYYYSTETDANSGKLLGGAVTAFDASEENEFAAYDFGEETLVAITEAMKSRIDAPKNSIADKSYAMAEVMNIENEDEPEEPEEDSEELPTEVTNVPEDVVLGDDDNTDVVNAVVNPVYAEEEIVNDGVLSRLDAQDVNESPAIPADTAANLPDIRFEEIPSVPAADVVITLADEPYYETVATYVEASQTTPVAAQLLTTVATTAASAEAASAEIAPTAAVVKSVVPSETFTVRYGGELHTVDSFELICAIVNNEISSSFSDEAIKAQAVAAYSYVKYHEANGLTANVLVKYGASERIVNLVAEVWGKCCYYDGKVAQTVYMASSSGYTASSVNVWGGSYPYLVSVECPFDSASDPNYGVRVKFSESDIRSCLEKTLGITLSDSPSNWLAVMSYVDGNYVGQLNVDGQAVISGRKMRESVLGYRLKSASFDVTYSDGYFIFTTYGYGHGVGMSQNGANILAKQGYSYDEILKYYFTGIDVL